MSTPDCMESGNCPDPQVSTTLREIVKELQQIKTAIAGDRDLGTDGLVPRVTRLEKTTSRVFYFVGAFSGSLIAFEYVFRVLKP